ncbi:hypothetical protein [Coleofasciculus chthonoplastes]|uniref:hypothetical protein n=1 Tax=Coleofasciculus chthonoplastes TaxID=64178 RepID=UPI00030CF3E6|nr:hypothetical protein [Coleofasciculus chthonoplastes]
MEYSAKSPERHSAIAASPILLPSRDKIRLGLRSDRLCDQWNRLSTHLPGLCQLRNKHQLEKAG